MKLFENYLQSFRISVQPPQYTLFEQTFIKLVCKRSLIVLELYYSCPRKLSPSNMKEIGAKLLSIMTYKSGLNQLYPPQIYHPKILSEETIVHFL